MAAIEPFHPSSSIPPALAERGVQFVDAPNGARMLHIPDALHKNANVLLPVSEIAQADPLYQPSIRFLFLDVKRHTYPGQKDGELALSKPGVLALAEAAGIEVVSTSRMSRDGLMPTEFGWQAVVRVRRSDGTWRHFTSSKIVDVDDERLAIELQVRTGKYTKDKPEEQKLAAIAKRLASEKPHWNAKAETKAILRAIRAVLQLPPAYTQAEITRPFVVVGWNLSIDYSDPAARAAAIENGLSSGRTMYALPAAADATPDADDGVVDGEWTDVDADEQAAAEAGAPAGVDLETGEWTRDDDPPSDADYQPADAPAASTVFQRPRSDAEKIVQAVGTSIVPKVLRRHAGKTVAAVYDEAADYLEWVAGPKFVAKSDVEQVFKSQIGDYLLAKRIVAGGAS